MSSRRTVLALCAFFVAVAVAVAGCGSSTPAGSVASVAGNPISKQAINHWMYLYSKVAAEEGESSSTIVPNDPPQFASCVAQERKSSPTAAKETTAQLRAACKQSFTTYATPVLGYLISSYWYQADAARLNLPVSQTTAQTQLTKDIKQEFKTQAKYAAYLKQSGTTNADQLYEIRIGLIEQKIVNHYTPKVTSADISNYYAQHKANYGTPQTRNMRIVLAKTATGAKAALSALRSGQSWGTVAKKYSIDPTTKDRGGLLTDVEKGQQDAALSSAAFSAPVGKLEGPVKGEFGYYVVQVLKITPGTQESLTEAKASISATLKQNGEQSAEKAIEADLKKRYGSRTTCASGYAIVNLCHNYKAPSTASSTATTPAQTSTAASSTASGSATTTTSSTTSH